MSERGNRMAEQIDPNQLVFLEQLGISQVVQQEALTGLVIDKGICTKEEFLEKVRVLDEWMKTKNERRAAPKKMVTLKVGAMPRIKILTIVLGIIVIGCFASRRPSMPRIDPEGFRDIKWGTEISTLKDMEEVEQDKSSGRDLVWYKRKGDTLTIGEAKLENIFYSFWMGEFESVWIDFEGEENLQALKKEFFERFGKARGSEGSVDKVGKRARRERSPTERPGAFYAWWGKNTEIWLSYSKDRHKGTLTMNSRKISEERKDYEKEKEKEERLKE
jgi:hypothetical protein